MIDFVGKRKIFFIISIALVAVTLLGSLFLGLNLDIQYKGGTMLTYSYTGDINKDDFLSKVQEVVGGSAAIQESSDLATGSTNLVVSLASTSGLSADKQVELTDALSQTFAANNIHTESISNVNASIGREFFLKSLVAVLFAAIVMVVYIGFRFKRISGWSAGVMAVIALVHDIIAVVAVFVFFRLSVDANFMAVVLTILGYSINDTIVIYDRIRENRRIYGQKLPVGELVNKSINQSMKRAIVTTVTTVMALVVIAVVTLIFNVTPIVTFVFPLIIGLLSGTYSSVCLVPCMWVMWQEYRAKKAGQSDAKKK